MPELKMGENNSNLNVSNIDILPFRNVLSNKFSKGFRLNSFINMKKFKRYYEELNGTACDFDKEQLREVICKCGIEYNNWLYLPELMLSEEMKEKLFTYIEEQFAKGITVIYFVALFDKFKDDFLDYTMYDAKMLRAYVAYFLSNKYFIGKDYLANEATTSVDPMDEIRSVLKENVYPIQTVELCKKLPHIPENKIRDLLATNYEFVRNRKGEYFHADSLDLSTEELAQITQLISHEITINGFISGNELYELIKKAYPVAFERNKEFSVIGWRDALKYKLGDKFSFYGAIISPKNHHVSMNQVFSRFAKNRQSFTLQELLLFTQNVGTAPVIYFEPLYEYAVRISKEQFIRKDNVSFQVAETDKVLESFCQGDYVSLKKIDNFGIFPDASHPWNEYLLENYLAFHSETFRLLHGGYNRNYVVGAMVKRDSGIKDFDELLTRVIAENKVLLKKEEALNYLAAEGYIARRSYSQIEQILIKARAWRNRKDS